MGSAVISDCGQYRYRLEREWDRGNLACAFVMLNPSTADATEDDPTIRRCIGYAKRWGFRKLIVANLYGFRATKPADLWKANDCKGPKNLDHIYLACQDSRRVVLAWGAHGVRGGYGRSIEALLRERSGREIVVLNRTKAGEPVHPLYQRADIVPNSDPREG